MAGSIPARPWALPWVSVVVLFGSSFSILEAELGLSIHKVRGRGYQLAAPLTLLDPVQHQRRGPSCEWPVLVFDSIDSTNAEALRADRAGQAAPFLVLAERQTAGRGRRGRNGSAHLQKTSITAWCLRIDGGMRQLEGLSLVVGLAVMQALRELGVPGCWA